MSGFIMAVMYQPVCSHTQGIRLRMDSEMKKNGQALRYLLISQSWTCSLTLARTTTPGNNTFYLTNQDAVRLVVS